MKRVYVAGPYSADNVIDVLTNMRRGMRLAYLVLQAGFAPFVPWFDHHFAFMGPVSLDRYYRYSMSWLEASDAVIVQTLGAAASKGTRAEIARATELGIPVFYSLDELVQWGSE